MRGQSPISSKNIQAMILKTFMQGNHSTGPPYGHFRRYITNAKN